MKYTVEKKEPYLHVTFSASAAEWESFMEKAYEQNKGKYNVPGFRKGHTPRRVLEQNYGKDLFFEDAIYLCASEYFKEYMEKNTDVNLVGRPKIEDNIDYKEGKGIKITLSFPVKPEVELGDYKALEIKKETAAVTDEEVAHEIGHVQERNARVFEVTDRPVAEGDEIVLDYSGSVDGVKFDGGTAENQKLKIGSHTFIPGFEEQLVGAAIGETKDISVKFPEDYHAENLKGKDAVFTCKIHSISKSELPEINDEFAKEVSEFSTLAEYKEDLKKNLLVEKQKQADIHNENKMLEAISANAKVEIPSEMIDEQIEDYVEDFKYQLSYQGLKLEDYFKYTKTTEEQLKESYRERALSTVKTRLVLDAILKAEKITVDDSEIRVKMDDYAKQIGQEADKFASTVTHEQKDYFENQALTEKLIGFLKAQNTFVD